MSILSGISHAVRRAQLWRRDAASTSRRTDQGSPIRDSFERRAAAADTSWWKGRPLSEARNAHTTNTRGDFERALREQKNWLEGDVRQEINSDRLEMRHDKGHESGDNLTLREWLTMGKASGRGLKLDVKEGRHIGSVLDEVAAAKIPSERLMFNLGDSEMRKWSTEIRTRFPDATLAVNPPAGGGKLERSQIDAMIQNATLGGAPVTFVVRHDQLTDEAIQRLRVHGTLSVWNAPGDIPGEKVDKVTSRLRRVGVDGVIDLRPPPGVGGLVDIGLGKAKGWLADRWQSLR